MQAFFMCAGKCIQESSKTAGWRLLGGELVLHGLIIH